MRVLVVAEFSALGEAVIEGLLAGQHEIVEIWYGSGRSGGDIELTARQARTVAKRLKRLDKGRGLPFRNVSGTSHADLLSFLDAIGRPPGLVSAGSAIIFRKPFLDAFEIAVNFHPAMLPHYRGPHPLDALILHGDADRYGGMTMHLINAGIDEGAIVAQRAIPRSSARHGLDWRHRLSRAAGQMIEVDFARLISGQIKPSPQALDAGSYVRLEDHQFTINGAWTVQQVERVMTESGVIGQKRLVRSLGSQRGYFVCGPPKVLGPPSGEDMMVGSWSVELDVDDGRLILGRERRPQRWRRKLFMAWDRLRYGSG
ncbi:MAG: formyltransferase family protein [Pseudomonadota bacterium]